MIQGKTKTEANYRAINLDSSSSLKDFIDNRVKYYRKYILNEDVKEKDNHAITIGNVVETLLYEPHLFDEKFYMSACANPPTAMMLAFVEALYQSTVDSIDEDGNIGKSFSERSKEAYELSGYKIAYDRVIKSFIGSDAEIYFEEILKVRRNNLTVVTADIVSICENIVEKLQTNDITADIVNLCDDERYTVMHQLQVEDYTLDGLQLKSMMDQVVIDHEEKTLQVYDLKCVWTVEKFYEEYYLYRKAYIQAYVYKEAAKRFIEASEDFKGYTVLNPRFIVCDSSNYYSPLIYTLSDSDIKDAYEGFEHKGREYRGVKDTIQDLLWALENDTWDISRENYLNKGIVNIKS